jgi:hypothetical protein
LADEQGVSPVEWIESTISRHAPAGTGDLSSQNLADALAPYIGAVDSSTVKPDPRYRSPFGDLVDQKLAKQGIKPPQWEQ